MSYKKIIRRGQLANIRRYGMHAAPGISRRVSIGKDQPHLRWNFHQDLIL